MFLKNAQCNSYNFDRQTSWCRLISVAKSPKNHSLGDTCIKILIIETRVFQEIDFSATFNTILDIANLQFYCKNTVFGCIHLNSYSFGFRFHDFQRKSYSLTCIIFRGSKKSPIQRAPLYIYIYIYTYISAGPLVGPPCCEGFVSKSLILLGLQNVIV